LSTDAAFFLTILFDHRFDGRLNMLNLKDARNLNTLTPETINNTWMPQVVFSNTREKSESEVDEKAFAMVEKRGTSEQRGLAILQSGSLYKGTENPIILSRTYFQKFLCNFDMAFYPFDSQRCTIVLIMKGNLDNFVELSASVLNYLGPEDLTLYFVKNYDIVNGVDDGDVSAVKVELIFARRMLTPILTVFLPTFIICVMSFSTNFFKAFFFEAVVTVNVTSLLVLTTLFISVSESLPQTAYIKFIDVWLIGSLLVPFAVVTLITYVEYFSDSQTISHHGSETIIKKNKVESIDKNKVNKFNLPDKRKDPKAMARRVHKVKMMSRYGLPGLYLVFCVVYFAIGTAHYLGNDENIVASN